MFALGLLIVRPKHAFFQCNLNALQNFTPQIIITFDQKQLKTDISKEMGNTPKWNNSLDYLLTENHFQSNPIIFIEGYDTDPTTNKFDFLGRASIELSSLKKQLTQTISFTLIDNKNIVIATCDIEFQITLDKILPDSILKTCSINSKSFDQSPLIQSPKKILLGTIIIRLIYGKFSEYLPDIEAEKPYLILSHDELKSQISSATFSIDKYAQWKEIISFPHIANEDLKVKCFSSKENNEKIGEALIRLQPIRSSYNGPLAICVNFKLFDAKCGELSLEIEMIPDTFDAPIKVYPMIEVRKSSKIYKTIVYKNPDNFDKTIVLKTSNDHVIEVKTPLFVIAANGSGLIRLKFISPPSGNVRCRVDIIVQKTNIIEESLLFKIKTL